MTIFDSNSAKLLLIDPKNCSFMPVPMPTDSIWSCEQFDGRDVPFFLQTSIDIAFSRSPDAPLIRHASTSLPTSADTLRDLYDANFSELIPSMTRQTPLAGTATSTSSPPMKKDMTVNKNPQQHPQHAQQCAARFGFPEFSPAAMPQTDKPPQRPSSTLKTSKIALKDTTPLLNEFFVEMVPSFDKLSVAFESSLTMSSMAGIIALSAESSLVLSPLSVKNSWFIFFLTLTNA
mmetsp:Transcript_84264/g.235146  ORF Transcript_84264/g.235146 Transcript_84264/m.235146 type:complete len:233 (-) Transcript_84264:932-1630(-)